MAESEELSESVAQLFLEGKLDQDGFIKQYRELRKVYHLREMKNERIGTILRSHSALPTASSSGSGSGNNAGGGGPGSTSRMDSISSRPGMGGITGSSSGMMSPGVLSSLGGLSLSTNSSSGLGGGGGPGSASSAGLGSGGGGGNGGPGSASPKDAWEVL